MGHRPSCCDLQLQRKVSCCLGAWTEIRTQIEWLLRDYVTTKLAQANGSRNKLVISAAADEMVSNCYRKMDSCNGLNVTIVWRGGRGNNEAERVAEINASDQLHNR